MFFSRGKFIDAYSAIKRDVHNSRLVINLYSVSRGVMGNPCVWFQVTCAQTTPTGAERSALCPRAAPVTMRRAFVTANGRRLGQRGQGRLFTHPGSSSETRPWIFGVLSWWHLSLSIVCTHRNWMFRYVDICASSTADFLEEDLVLVKLQKLLHT